MTGQSVTLDLGQNVPSEYTVCGLIKDEDANNSYEVLVSRAFLESWFSGRDIPYSALIRMAGGEAMGTDELKQYILACMEPYGFEEADIAFSSSYFDTFDNASSNTLTTVLVGILIVIACSTVIYSLFYISVTGKVKEYGRLRIVGITQKQMKRLVRKESRKLSLLSIPLGIVIGSIIGYLLIPGGWYLPNTVRFAGYYRPRYGNNGQAVHTQARADRRISFSGRGSQNYHNNRCCETWGHEKTPPEDYTLFPCRD